MGVYQREGRWMVFYRDESGKRFDKSFGRGHEAQDKANKFDLAIKLKKRGIELPEGSDDERLGNQSVGNMEIADKRLTFKMLTEKYLKHVEISGRSEKYVKMVRLLCNNMFYYLIGNKVVDDMTYMDDFVMVLGYLKNNNGSKGFPRSQSTLNRYGDYLNAIFNFGIQMKLTSVNPVVGRKKVKELPRNVKLTVDDVNKIMDHADEHIKWAMEVNFNLGIRSGESELLALKWEHIDLEKREVTVYAPKTHTSRLIPISDEFAQKLKKKMEEAQSEFVVEFKGRGVSSIAKGFRHACQRAGITYPVRMYDLRHLFASTMLAKGADLAAVSKLMGHASIKMTADVYYHAMHGEKERAISLLPKLAVA